MGRRQGHLCGVTTARPTAPLTSIARPSKDPSGIGAETVAIDEDQASDTKPNFAVTRALCLSWRPAQGRTLQACPALTLPAQCCSPLVAAMSAALKASVGIPLEQSRMVHGALGKWPPQVRGLLAMPARTSGGVAQTAAGLCARCAVFLKPKSLAGFAYGQ